MGAGFLDGPFDEPPDAGRAGLHGRPKLARRDETSGECPRGCFDDYTRVDTDVGNVGDGPGGRCDLNAESRRYFIAPQRNGRRVELDAGRGRRVPRPVLAGQREVNRV